jgi:hypothetical protein
VQFLVGVGAGEVFEEAQELLVAVAFENLAHSINLETYYTHQMDC